jgi:hypothetical protein
VFAGGYRRSAALADRAGVMDDGMTSRASPASSSNNVLTVSSGAGQCSRAGTQLRASASWAWLMLAVTMNIGPLVLTNIGPPPGV